MWLVLTFVSDVICRTNFTLKHFFQIIFLNLEMDSSDEDYLPDPNRPRKRKRPPDHGEASGSGQRRKLDEQDNKQVSAFLFILSEVILMSEMCSD